MINSAKNEIAAIKKINHKGIIIVPINFLILLLSVLIRRSI